jgi:RNA polymerase sigma-70 factor (ECF subfamily)
VIDVTTEAELVARLRQPGAAARSAALGELYRLLGQPLLRLCLRIACHRADAEDALQETFVDVLRALPSFRGEARFSTWVFRIAIRAAMRARNRRSRDSDRLGASDDTAKSTAAPSNLSRESPDPSELVLERENAERILAAIERLPAMQRTVLGLAAIEELPQTEIAEILGVPVGTVYSRLNAARESLRQQLAR